MNLPQKVELPQNYLKKVFIKNEEENELEEVDISQVGNYRNREFKILAPDLAHIKEYVGSRKPDQRSRTGGNRMPICIRQDIFSKEEFSGYENVYTMKWKNTQRFQTLVQFLAKYGLRPIHKVETATMFRPSEDIETLFRGVAEGGAFESGEDDLEGRGDDDNEDNEEAKEIEIDKENSHREDSVTSEIIFQKFVPYMDLSAMQLRHLLEEKDEIIARLQTELSFLTESHNTLLNKYSEEISNVGTGVVQEAEQLSKVVVQKGIEEDGVQEAEQLSKVVVQKGIEEDGEEAKGDEKESRKEKKLRTIFEKWILMMKNKKFSLEKAQDQLSSYYSVELIAQCYLRFHSELEKEERAILKVCKKDQDHWKSGERVLHRIFGRWVLIMKNNKLSLEKAQDQLSRYYNVELIAQCYSRFQTELKKETRKLGRVEV